ncbi:MAG: MerR family transcriptional regulator [Acidobacteriaceae bacterium]
MYIEYVGIRKAAQILAVNISTLRKWEKAGKIMPLRTPGGHRRYTEAQLQEFLRGRT